jgi:hypothetical protein
MTPSLRSDDVMNPQIVFNINLAAEAAHAAAGLTTDGALASAERAALPTPMDVLGAASAVSQRLPTPMDMEGRSERGERQLPTPMEAMHVAAGAVSGGLPTPFDAVHATAGAAMGGLPTPTMLGPTEVRGGAARGDLPKPEDLDVGGSSQRDEPPEPRPRDGKK